MPTILQGGAEQAVAGHSPPGHYGFLVACGGGGQLIFGADNDDPLNLQIVRGSLEYLLLELANFAPLNFVVRSSGLLYVPV